MSEQERLAKSTVENLLNNIKRDSSNEEKTTDGLIDPMLFEESEGALDEKRKVWNEIFDRCPDFSDFVIDAYSNSEDGEKELMIMEIIFRLSRGR